MVDAGGKEALSRPGPSVQASAVGRCGSALECRWERHARDRGDGGHMPIELLGEPAGIQIPDDRCIPGGRKGEGGEGSKRMEVGRNGASKAVKGAILWPSLRPAARRDPLRLNAQQLAMPSSSVSSTFSGICCTARSDTHTHTHTHTHGGQAQLNTLAPLWQNEADISRFSLLLSLFFFLSSSFSLLLSFFFFPTHTHTHTHTHTRTRTHALPHTLSLSSHNTGTGAPCSAAIASGVA